tara:strand:+ start:3037 stop:4209 length:1173 start_codon:yes stop_codon:yes gene_type:complete
MATKINLRSPYYIKVSKTNLTSAQLVLYIYTGNFTANSSVAASTLRYTIIKKPLGSNDYVVFEVSELVRDYLDLEFDGQYIGQNIWLNAIATVTGGTGSVTVTPDNANGFLGFDGYGYYEEGANPQITSPVFISNNTILKLDDSSISIPLDTSTVQSVAYLLNGELIRAANISSSTNSGEQIKYTTNGVNGSDSFQSRVIVSGGTFEDSICLMEFEDDFIINDFDSIHVTYTDNNISKVKILKVENINECKYDPIKVTFVNKFGALQDIIFFKKSIEKTDVKGEEFKASVFDSATLTYKTYQHQRTQFMVQGNDSITMNTGYMPEDYNQVIEQLMLSEQVWGTFTTDTEVLVKPLVPKTKSITYKTRLNDKLIDYTIDFEMANNKINNIR